MEAGTASNCLIYFCKWLYDHYGKKAIILIDEYDTPMQEAYVSGYWDEIIEFMQNMFNGALKTNPYMHKALLTGITRVSRESFFSDLNNIKVITSSSQQYADCFGFTEGEVFDALDNYGLIDAGYAGDRIQKLAFVFEGKELYIKSIRFSRRSDFK